MIADAIRTWQQPYVVTRTALPTYDANGRVVAGATSTVNIEAAIVPLTGRELERLPEGLRTKEIRAVYTTTQLYALDATHAPDLIAVGADTWQVETVNDWSSAGAFFMAIARKL